MTVPEINNKRLLLRPIDLTGDWKDLYQARNHPEDWSQIGDEGPPDFEDSSKQLQGLISTNDGYGWSILQSPSGTESASPSGA